MPALLVKLFLLLSLAGCAKDSLDTARALKKLIPSKPAVQVVKETASPDLASAIASAEPSGKKVLHTIGNMMAAEEVIVGACWDYLNEAFNRAGYPSHRRDIIFKGTYEHGPYADNNLIKPGDWLYYVNHSYHDIQHSGLFIGWTNRAKNKALIFSYAGEGRKNPARMRVYHIDQVYQIMRAKN
ncbi:hypothetical protein KRX19_05365 [Cardiobacteriaceae bacterium TAE3-ERU3]|nr:hypothetical protein [Cardiobacteriaceae bacterium TAE3-ERU3]